MTFSRGRDGGKEGIRSRSPSTSSFSFFRRVRSAGMFRGVQAEGRCREGGMIRYVLFRGVHAQEAVVPGLTLYTLDNL